MGWASRPPESKVPMEGELRERLATPVGAPAEPLSLMCSIPLSLKRIIPDCAAKPIWVRFAVSYVLQPLSSQQTRATRQPQDAPSTLSPSYQRTGWSIPALPNRVQQNYRFLIIQAPPRLVTLRQLALIEVKGKGLCCFWGIVNSLITTLSDELLPASVYRKLVEPFFPD